VNEMMCNIFRYSEISVRPSKDWNAPYN